MAPKRGRNPIDDDTGGPSKVQLKGLAWNASAAQPAFLKNALSALQGPKPARHLDDSGRPPIPVRPEGEEGESEEDEWDMGRGEEAPAVVVLKEGKHIDRDEVDRMRAEAKSASAADPLASSSASTLPTKASGSLSFNSSTSSTSNLKPKPEGTETWEDVIKRSKVEGEMKKLAKERQEKDEAKEKEKKEKKRIKEKKQEKKKVGLLSFADE